MDRLTGIGCIAALAFLSAGCDKTPEQARKTLIEKNVALDEKSLLEQTKNPKSEDTARLLVQAGVDPNARQANGMTALMSAAFNGQHDTARLLIERGARVNDVEKGFTALRLAVEKGDRAMIELLLKHGADPGLRPDGAPSALDKALQGKDDALIALLRRKPGG